MCNSKIKTHKLRDRFPPKLIPWYGYVRTYFLFFCTLERSFLFRPRVFSRALGGGARREPAFILQRKLGPQPGFVERALGVHSREELALFAGPLSAEPEPTRTMETHRKEIRKK